MSVNEEVTTKELTYRFPFERGVGAAAFDGRPRRLVVLLFDLVIDFLRLDLGTSCESKNYQISEITKL